MFEETGKWPSEHGRGHRARPGQRRAAGGLSGQRRGAANVNGQVFHSYGYGYTLLEQPHAVRSIEADRRWDPEELARIFPQTLGANLQAAAGDRVRHRAGRAARPRSGPRSHRAALLAVALGGAAG